MCPHTKAKPSLAHSWGFLSQDLLGRERDRDNAWMGRASLGTGRSDARGGGGWEMSWQCDGRSRRGDLPSSSSPPLLAPPYGAGSFQAARVEGGRREIPSCSSGEKGSSCGCFPGWLPVEESVPGVGAACTRLTATMGRQNIHFLWVNYLWHLKFQGGGP